MDKIINVINSPWFYFSGLACSIFSLLRRIFGSAHSPSLFLCGFSIGFYLGFFVLTVTQGPIVKSTADTTQENTPQE